MRWMYDAAYPPENPPHWHVCAGYIGGDTPHVWSKAEWDAQWAPCRLPIFTADNRVNNPASAAADAPVILAALRELGVPAGKAVALDGETRVFPAYLEELDKFLGGYRLVDYGSLSYVVQNPVTSGGRWAAHWTGWSGRLAMAPGLDVVATQLAAGEQFDESVIEEFVPLWTVR